MGRVVLPAVIAPIVMALFLLLMERLEASLFPVVIRDVPREDVSPQEEGASPRAAA